MKLTDNRFVGISFYDAVVFFVAVGASMMISTAWGQTAQSINPNVTCSAKVQVDDTLRFSPPKLEVPMACEQFTVLLSHVGRLPKVASPRNWVLTTQAAADAVARDAELAGAANGWVKPDDEQVLAASSVIGSGETVRVQFEVAKLQPEVQYTYLSTIPGFSPVLRGTLTVVP